MQMRTWPNKARLTLDPDNSLAIVQRAKISPPDVKGPQEFSTLLNASNSVDILVTICLLREISLHDI